MEGLLQKLSGVEKDLHECQEFIRSRKAEGDAKPLLNRMLAMAAEITEELLRNK